jgi:hypothetical protein
MLQEPTIAAPFQAGEIAHPASTRTGGSCPASGPTTIPQQTDIALTLQLQRFDTRLPDLNGASILVTVGCAFTRHGVIFTHKEAGLARIPAAWRYNSARLIEKLACGDLENRLDNQVIRPVFSVRPSA